MYLKSIELYGFKSFAERTKIEFNENITCIVGPNGSGKSNITDAIRWVLGEQSTLTLRGSKMSDVIFSGTDHRRSLGMAEVIITFDNESRTLDLDYNIVEVKRRLYKNGDSEYYINNNQCRLKDVRELFMDTGIGRDGYSIIGQGRIDAILNSRPSERRSIFEEAAGISKFKFQKQDTERKLEKTRENLFRLQDLLSEIESQKDNLKIQAAKAEKYNDLYYKILKADINNLALDLLEIDKSIKDLNDRKIKQVAYKEKISQNLETLKDTYSKNRSYAEELEEKINFLQLENIENVRKEKDLYNQISLAKERKTNKEKENEELLLRKKIKIEDLGKLDEEIDSLNTELKSIEEKIKTLEEKENTFISSLETRSNNTLEKNTLLEEINQKIQKLNENISLSTIRIDTLSNLNTERLANKEKIKESFNKSDADRLILKNSIDGINNKLEDLKNSFSANNKELNEIKIKKQELSRLIESKRSDYTKLQGLINNQELRLNTLKNMEENYEGYNKSIRDFFSFIKNRNLQIDGLHDSVANLISVPKEYEKAISTALGGASQNLVVEKYDQAQAIIEILRKNNLGRITFLPMDTIKGYKKNFKTSSDLYIDLASNLVSYDPLYDKIVRFLLENVIVVKDLSYAKKIYSSGTTNMKIVTLDGDVLNPGGSVSGGSNNWSGNIFNRKNELDQIKIDLEANKKSLLTLDREGKSLLEDLTRQDEEIKDLSLENSNLESQLKALEKEYFEGQLKLDSYDNNILDINTSLENLDQLIDEGKEEIKRLLENKKTSDEDLIRLAEEKNRLLTALEDLDQEKTNITDEKNKLNISLNNIRNEKMFTSKNFQRLLLEKSKLEEDIKFAEDSNEENLKFLSALANDIKNWEEELEEISQINGSFTDNFKALNDQRKSQNELLDRDLKKINDNKETVLELEKDIYVIDNNLENSYEKKSYIADYVGENYNLSLFDFSLEEVYIEKIMSKSAVKKLKQDLTALGDINLGAIKSYREVKERFDFTKKQYEDLATSEEKLKKLLREIEKTMEEKFSQSFKEINKNFNRIFNYLFEGGSSNLILVDDDNPIEAGVDIEAQLPGKKKQLLSAMSGGERSLTTVALIFALLETRPAPFCLLDEVDAALDDANIKRFLSYLKNLNNIQFAIVTHRKTTMAAADYIYGVTMEETGVSKVISLKFNGGK